MNLALHNYLTPPLKNKLSNESTNDFLCIVLSAQCTCKCYLAAPLMSVTSLVTLTTLSHHQIVQKRQKGGQ